ncbi:MAG TPA: DUF309 domain-containing protein [Anaerolineales bacterium]|nr:DUF309 domain-containing protein [Anaerolineales bacterium]
MKDHPIILVFVEDLITAVRIDSVAQEVGFEFVQWEISDQNPGNEGSAPERQRAEPLHGKEAMLIERITALRPALIIFDLGNKSIPSLDWISLITSVPATRGIPVLCFGPHVDQENLLAAKQAGADLSVARSKFMKSLPDLLSENAKVIDEAELLETCQEELSHFGKKGLREFNRGKYFHAHDLLELAWLEDRSPGRDLYRAILQVSVAYYQIERGNYNGAMKMFIRMRKWFGSLPDTCRGINIGKLRQDVQAVQASLMELGPDEISKIELGLMKPIEYNELH